MTQSVPTSRPSWAWNYRWTIIDAERAIAMARRGEHPSTIAREFSATVDEVSAMLTRNGIRTPSVLGGAMQSDGGISDGSSQRVGQA
jgi:hypothetical protein